jgi:hypothetical protein
LRSGLSGLLRRFHQLDKNFAAFRGRHEEKIHARLICSFANLRIHRLQLKASPKNVRGSRNISHIALYLLNAFSKAR